MEIKCWLEQFPALDKSNYRVIQAVFDEQLDQISNKVEAIIPKLNDKPLIKCHLIPEKVPQPKYDGVILGGTFDYMHIGHELLLLTAILMAKCRIVVGLTGDVMLQKKKNKELVQHFQIRHAEIEQYVRKIKPNLHLEIVELHDMYGPAIIRQDVEAIIVSAQTRIGGEKINEVRKQNKLKQLVIEVCPLASKNNKVDQKLSSTHVREYILTKNQMSIKQIEQYKGKWFKFNDKLNFQFGIAKTVKQKEVWWNQILIQYSQYWRYYHTNAHIAQLLKQFQRNERKNSLTIIEQLAIEAGIWFHDIEYLPSSKNNEQKSAQTCIQFFNSFEPQKNHNLWNSLKQLAKLAILDTKNHKTQSEVSKILIDIDMSILDSPPQMYSNYASNVKRQYEPVVGDLYNEKRAEFLKSLNLNEIFYYRKPTYLASNIEAQLKILAYKQSSEL